MVDLEQGIVFPENRQGKRSSTDIFKKVLSESVNGFEPDLAANILKEKKWRQQYLHYINRINLAGIKSAAHALQTARSGLDAAYHAMRFIRGNAEMTIDEAMDRYKNPVFRTAVINGAGAKDPQQPFQLPYRNRLLSGRALLDQVDTWEEKGIFESSFGRALRNVARNSDWTDLTGRTFVVMGAGSEIAPLKTLLNLGATVAAIDLARPDIWKRLIQTARKSPGRLLFPIRGTFDSKLGDNELSTMAGADLACDTPEIRTWLNEIDQPMTIGAYAYADGALHVRIVMAMDAIINHLTRQCKDHTVAFLLTPSDSFAVPMSLVKASESKIQADRSRSIFRFISMGNMFKPHNKVVQKSENGFSYGISDNMIAQQGPGYILAKNIQKWRCLVARENGIRVSGNVAPATTTRSVFKNKILAAGYAGLAHFKAEAFESKTTSAIMTAALINDLNDEKSAANPCVVLDHPFDFFVHSANHGGLWRVAYEPRSILAFSVLLGCLKTVKIKLSTLGGVIRPKKQKEYST